MVMTFLANSQDVQLFSCLCLGKENDLGKCGVCNYYLFQPFQLTQLFSHPTFSLEATKQL